MDMISAKDAAQRWGVTPRRVQDLCKRGEIAGAVQWQRMWLLPENATYPTKRSEKETSSDTDRDLPMPRRTPFLYMSDLYHSAGTADESAAALAYNKEAQVLFEAEVAYSRGQIDKVYESANYLLDKHSGFYAVLSAGMLLALCAIWRGDLELWRRAKVHIFEAPAKDDNDRDIMQLAITAVDSMLYNVSGFPEWFKIGNFEPLHPDTLPAAKVYYAKYLYASAYSVATKQLEIKGISGLALMSIIPGTIEPMISQARADHSLISEMYLRLTCAAVYHNSGNDTDAVRHIDRAIELALPDRLYGLLAEYFRPLDRLLSARIDALCPEAATEIKTLYKIYNDGWSKLSGSVRGRQIITTLSPMVREVAKLAAFGMGNNEIADKLNMSVAGVKQAIKITSEKSGMDRRDFAAIL